MFYVAVLEFPQLKTKKLYFLFRFLRKFTSSIIILFIFQPKLSKLVQFFAQWAWVELLYTKFRAYI